METYHSIVDKEAGFFSRTDYETVTVYVGENREQAMRAIHDHQKENDNLVFAYVDVWEDGKKVESITIIDNFK